MEYDAHWTKSDKKDFIGCCTLEEKEMLKIVIMKIIEYKSILSKETIYIAVLYYYYSSIVLEYYATNFCSLDFFKNTYYKSLNINEVIELIKEITISN
jgi:hypothetical protein